jgi:hypothetical protein
MRLRPGTNLNDRASFVHAAPTGFGIDALPQGPNDWQITGPDVHPIITSIIGSAGTSSGAPASSIARNGLGW